MTVRVPVARRVASMVAALVAIVLLAAVPSAAAASDTARDRAVVLVDGAVQHRLRLSTADLAALPQYSITVTFQSGTGTQTHTYAGPLLLDVLNRAQPRFNPDVKNDNLRHVITATGTDRYQAAIAWGEIDPGFEHKTVLVGLTEDGQPAADGRPRIVVPGDIRGGRYVASLVRLHLSQPGR